MEKREKQLKKKFNENEKRLLIAAVKKQQHIWDKRHKLHCNRNAIKAAWKEIANEIEKPDEACKYNWRSILDSKRYYKKRKVDKKSGSGCELEFLSEESNDPWEFSEDLEFLTEASDLRSTSSSQLLFPALFQPIDSSSNDFEMPPSTSAESKTPRYSYRNATISPKNSFFSEMKESVSKVAEVMTTLVDVAKQQTNKKNDNAPFLNYVDSLLLKLPTDVAQNVQSKIIAMLHEEIAARTVNQTEIMTNVDCDSL